MRRLVWSAVVLLLALLGAMALPAASASGTNIPHRAPVANQPFDLPIGFCAFPVHVTFAMDKEYATATALPDGSTVLKITGALFVTATNADTERSITMNASGPGTITVAPDGSSFTVDGRGVAFTYALNYTSFGAPSNVVLTAGPNVATIDTTTFMFTYMKNPPHVLLDVCAALS